MRYFSSFIGRILQLIWKFSHCSHSKKSYIVVVRGFPLLFIRWSICIFLVTDTAIYTHFDECAFSDFLVNCIQHGGDIERYVLYFIICIRENKIWDKASNNITLRDSHSIYSEYKFEYLFIRTWYELQIICVYSICQLKLLIIRNNEPFILHVRKDEDGWRLYFVGLTRNFIKNFA